MGREMPSPSPFLKTFGNLDNDPNVQNVLRENFGADSIEDINKAIVGSATRTDISRKAVGIIAKSPRVNGVRINTDDLLEKVNSGNIPRKVAKALVSTALVTIMKASKSESHG